MVCQIEKAKRQWLSRWPAADNPKSSWDFVSLEEWWAFQSLKQLPFKDISRVGARFAIAHKNDGLLREIINRWLKICRISNQDRFSYEDIYHAALFGYASAKDSKLGGLLRAVEEYNPALGNAFSSIAGTWIRGGIQHYVRANPLLKGGRRFEEIYDKVQNWILRSHNGDVPSDKVIERSFGLEAGVWQEIKQSVEAIRAVASLDSSDTQEIANTTNSNSAKDLLQYDLLVEIAARMPSKQWEVFQRIRLLQQPLHQVAKKLRMNPTTAAATLKKAEDNIKRLCA